MGKIEGAAGAENVRFIGLSANLVSFQSEVGREGNLLSVAGIGDGFDEAGLIKILLGLGLLSMNCLGEGQKTYKEGRYPERVIPPFWVLVNGRIDNLQTFPIGLSFELSCFSTISGDREGRRE